MKATHTAAAAVGPAKRTTQKHFGLDSASCAAALADQCTRAPFAVFSHNYAKSQNILTLPRSTSSPLLCALYSCVDYALLLTVLTTASTKFSLRGMWTVFLQLVTDY